MKGKATRTCIMDLSRTFTVTEKEPVQLEFGEGEPLDRVVGGIVAKAIREHIRSRSEMEPGHVGQLTRIGVDIPDEAWN